MEYKEKLDNEYALGQQSNGATFYVVKPKWYKRFWSWIVNKCT